MGCKGSKQTEVENTYGELNKNVQKTMMLRAGLNFGETSYGIQVGFLNPEREILQPLIIRAMLTRSHNL